MKCRIINIIIITVVLYSPLQDCVLRSAPSPASVKHNGLEGRGEGYGVMNRYLAKSDRKSIPGRRASNRKGMALAHGSIIIIIIIIIDIIVIIIIIIIIIII